MTRKHICIISFSEIRRDARVLRQIEYLSPDYDLTVIGHGDLSVSGVIWHPVPTSNTFNKLITILLLFLGRFFRPFYTLWYWQKPTNKQAFEFAKQSGAQAFHANDWNTLPVAIEAARVNQAMVIFDAHEYSPLEREDVWWWILLFAPMIKTMLHTYAPLADISMTVCAPIAERYKQEFGFEPMVVLNAPRHKEMHFRTLSIDGIRLIHHGSAIEDRHLEWMIEALAVMDSRFSLHFMLVGSPNYIQYLKTLADKLVAGRVTFLDPVAPEEVVQTIAEYDMGFYLLAPSNYNNYVALPNKFFDFIGAGLAVCVGPSPAMAEVVKQYGLGCVAPSFKPHDVAETLNKLTSEQVIIMRRAALRAAAVFNADTEMAKVVAMYHQLVPVSEGQA